MFWSNLVEKLETHVLFSIIFFFENHAVCEIMWKNCVQPDRSQETTGRIRIACWIPKATNTHTGCVILIVLTLQQWLHERVSKLLDTNIACLVNFAVGTDGYYVLA
jgi:hypothetical protein